MIKKHKILLPLIIAVSVIAGVLLGVKLEQRVSGEMIRSLNYFQPDKLSMMLSLIDKDYVDSISKQDLIEQTIPKVLKELDPHSAYIPAKDMVAVNEEMRGNFSGIGIQFTMQKDTVHVLDVISGGPSQKLGVLAGDRIVTVNDSIVAGIEIGTDSIVSLLRGKKGTKVNVGIKRSGVDQLIGFEITRGEIPLYSVDVSYMLNDKAGYIKVSRFAGTTHKEFVEGIEFLKTQGAEELVVDLRANSGGYLDQVIRMVDEFIPGGKLLLYSEGHARKRQNIYSSDGGIWEDKPVVVLIDDYSASASEIFAGALQDCDRGLIVGRRSFGKGLIQEGIPFMDGSVLRLTVARYHTPSGRCIQKPYVKGEGDDYQLELLHRYEHGEFLEADSIQFNDSLRYETANGRIVYGGGGIMPDIFVPADTTGISDLFAEIISKNYIYYFAFDYSDKHRTELQAYQSVSEFTAHLNEIGYTKKFIAHVKSEGVQWDEEGYRESKEIIEAQLYAYTARNILGDDAFYPVIQKIDHVLDTVNTVLEQQKTDPMLY